MLGRTVAQRIFGESDPVNQEIQVAAVRFKVSVVLAAALNPVEALRYE